MIQLKDINKTYHNGAPLHVLKGINLDIKKGEFVSIMGASGSGKSTLLNILGILDNYDTGEYYLNGTLIKNLSEARAAEYRNRMIGFIFQSFNLISFKNAVENVALPLFYQGVSRRKRSAGIGVPRPFGAEGVGAPHAQRNVRRTEAACRHRPRPHHAAADNPCRRAYRCIRQQDIGRGDADSEGTARHGNDHRRRDPRKRCRQPDGQDYPHQGRRDRQRGGELEPRCKPVRKRRNNEIVISDW